MDFKHIRFGLAFAMLAILLGGLMGLGFGCCEDSFKDKFKEDATSALKANITVIKTKQIKCPLNPGSI